jgi:hypothetical protein
VSKLKASDESKQVLMLLAASIDTILQMFYRSEFDDMQKSFDYIFDPLAYIMNYFIEKVINEHLMAQTEELTGAKS